MNKHLITLQSVLKKNQYLIAAFIIPLIIRSVPEILSWPYPIGVDNVDIIPLVRDNWAFSYGAILFFQRTNILYVIAAVFNWVVNDAVIVIKIFGPLLFAGLSAMMYIYARKGLNWSNNKSLLVSFLMAIYFVSLRNSWDLYRQTLGLIFLMAVLISLKSFSSQRKYYVAAVFMVLTVLGHELAAVIAFFIIGLEVLRLLFNKLSRDSLYLSLSVILPGALFLFQRYSLKAATVVIPVYASASEPSIALTLHMAGLMIYCYALVLPLVLFGLSGIKDWFLKYWMILCIGIPLLEMVNPNLPLYYWNRWIYLLVYPLLFYVAHGLTRLWNFLPKYKSKFIHLIPKAIAVVYLLLFLTLSGYYLTTTPENAFSYFSENNAYLVYIPSSMLQNTISIRDTPALVSCMNWIKNNAPEDSVLIAHYGIHDLSLIYLHDLLIVPVYQDTFIWAHIQNETILADVMVNSAQKAVADGYSIVYTVWWISGEGWYQIPTLPTSFQEVYRAERMAVYLYDPDL